MIIRDLDDRNVRWIINGGVNLNKSSYHIQARSIIREVYPTAQILEEVQIPVRRNQLLYLDFYLPLYKVAVEVQGQQHFKFNQHFHGSPAGFVQSKKRDLSKKEWCELNLIRYVALNYDEDLEKWREKLLL